MVSIKDRKILRQMFSHYDYVMTTAQLSKEKLYYRDIQRMLKAGLIEKVKRGYKVLSDYFHHLRTWKRQYAPQQPEDEWHPLFVEALQRESHIEYLLDVLLYGTAEEKKALVAEQRKEVIRLERRFAEHPDGHDRGGSQGKSGLDR